MKRGNTEFRFPLHDVLIVAGGVKEKKATIGALAKPWECVLGPKNARISLCCQICELLSSADSRLNMLISFKLIKKNLTIV